jgi:hypothetical protein
MKIIGWEKLKGITYKGYSITNPMVNAIHTQYIADVLDISKSYKMELRLDTDAGFRDSSYVLTISDRLNNVVVKRIVDFEMLKRISSFRMVYEYCIEDYIREVDKGVSLGNATNVATPISHSIVSNVTKRINGGMNQFDKDYGTTSLPTFDDFAKIWRSTPVGKFTQTLINK